MPRQRRRREGRGAEHEPMQTALLDLYSTALESRQPGLTAALLLDRDGKEDAALAPLLARLPSLSSRPSDRSTFAAARRRAASFEDAVATPS